MIQILGITIMIYSLAIIPVIAGGLIKNYVPGSRSSIEYVVLGWVGALSVFTIEAIVVITFEGSLSCLKNIWLVTMVFITLVGFLKNKDKIKQISIREVRKKIQKEWRMTAGIVLLIACSLLFVMPDLDDDTTEIVLEAYVTNTMYQYQPYTEEKYDQIPKENRFSPIEMYYAVMAQISDLHPAAVVKLVIPVFFLPIIILIYLLWAKKLFPDDKKVQNVFLMFVCIIFLFAVFSERMRGISVLQNCWKGEILLGTAILPFVCYYCIEIMGNIYEKGINKHLIAQYGIVLAITSLTSQLMYQNGIVFSGIILATGIGIVEVRRHWICSR